MAELSLERKFRLLHSWSEKAAKLLAREQPESKKAAATIRKSADMASAELDSTRRREQARLEELALALREKLDTLSASGTIRLDAPAPASDDDHPQFGEVEQIRTEIGRYNQVLGAQSANDLGGFLDLPLDEYPVALGLRRGDPSTGIQRFASTPKRVIIAAAISALLGVAGTLLYLQSARTIKVEIGEPLEGIVAVHLHNKTTDTLAFWIPFHGQRSDAENGYEDCGIRVLGHGPDEKEPSLLPVEIVHWQAPGLQGNPAQPLMIGPGLSLSVNVDVQAIRRDYGPFDRMILQCTSRNGKILDQAVYDLPPTS